MTDRARRDTRLDRLQLLAVVLPVAYIIFIVSAVYGLGLPLWAGAVITAGVSIPAVIVFAFLIFRSVTGMRDELMEREAKFRDLLESAPDAIVIVNADGQIVMVNEQAERIFGWRADELVGSDVDMLIPAQFRGAHLRQRVGYATEPARREMGSGLTLRGTRKDGSEFPAEISLSPIRTVDGLLVISTVRDITERKRMEAEREQLLAEAEAERERQRIGMDLHDGVIQSIYAVGLNLENAAADVSDDPPAVAKRIDRAIEQLNDVIRDIRSYIMDLRPARFTGDLGESLAALAEDFRANSLIETTVRVEPALPSVGEERAMAMFHIAQEALNNVRKHARATSVTLSLSRADGSVQLDVRDNGEGFAPGTEHGEEHRGLRNMASRARSAGGTLCVESAPGEGTLIRVALPAQEGVGDRA